MVTDSLSLRIVANRRKLEKKLSKKYALTEAQLAEFFQVPIRVIERDLRMAKISLSDTGEFFPLDKIKKVYYKNACKKEKEGLSREEALAECGFWNESNSFESKDRSFSGFEKCQILRMQKAVSLSSYGYSASDIKNILSGFGKVETELVKSELSKNGIIFGKEGDFAENFAKTRYEKGDPASDIKEAVGYAEVKLVKTNYNQYKEKYYEYLETYNKKHGIDKSPLSSKEKALEKEKKKQDCFQKWQNEGYTQQELADMYGVTRITIMNWMREMKTAHMDEMEAPVLRRRNLGVDKTEKREEDKAKYLEIMIPELRNGLSVYAVSEKYKLDWSKALKYAREEGLVSTRFENKSKGLDYVEAMEDSQKKLGYRTSNKNILFGYGPNAGTFASYKDVNKISTLNQYRKETEYELQNQAKAKEHFYENEGNMTDYWLERHIENDKKRKETVKLHEEPEAERD